MTFAEQQKIILQTKKLVHYPLCPLSRFIRLILSEKKVDYRLIEEDYWQKNEKFMLLNPAGTVPILIEPDHRTLIKGVYPIFEYLVDTLDPQEMPLLPSNAIERAEVRRLIAWFNDVFYHDVSNALLMERVIKRQSRDSYPDSGVIRKALVSLPYHIGYLADILSRRDWIGGQRMNAADLVVVAHLSVVDFLGNVAWVNQTYLHEFMIVREWYAKMKSRKSYRDILEDSVTGFTPPLHYANPDF